LVVAGYLGSLGVMIAFLTKPSARTVKVIAITFAFGWIIGAGWLLTIVSERFRWVLAGVLVPFVVWRCVVWARAAQWGRYPNWKEQWLPWHLH